MIIRRCPSCLHWPIFGCMIEFGMLWKKWNIPFPKFSVTSSVWLCPFRESEIVRFPESPQLLSPRFFSKNWDSTKPVFFGGFSTPGNLREADGNLTPEMSTLKFGSWVISLRRRVHSRKSELSTLEVDLNVCMGSQPLNDQDPGIRNRPQV